MEITPLRRSDVQLSSYCYQSFGAVIPKPLSKKDIVEPGLWVNVASKINMNDEIRVVDDNGSMMARLFVTYANGHDIRLRVLEHHVFETEDVAEKESPYFIKQRGVQKWCVMKKDTPDPVYANIATKHEAEKQLHEYRNALAR